MVLRLLVAFWLVMGGMLVAAAQDFVQPANGVPTRDVPVTIASTESSIANTDKGDVSRRTALAGEARSVQVPSQLTEIFGPTSTAKDLELTLTAYMAAAEDDGPTFEPLTPASASSQRPVYRMGHDFVVLPQRSYTETVRVLLPQGVWINYWTGAQVLGGKEVDVEVLGGRPPMWARGGAIIPQRTGGYIGGGFLQKKVQDKQPKCGSNCLFDVMPAFSGESGTVLKDADGHTLRRTADSLSIEGANTRATVRWRFAHVADVFVNGSPVQVQRSPDGYYATFDHEANTLVEWNVLGEPLGY